ncbi:MAG: C25 family cysteine peptidase [Cyclobacteriaceae bacterium]
MTVSVKRFICAIGVLLPLAVFGQSNSWINFSQKYYKIPVAQEGIYRLTYSNLQSAGIPVGAGGVDPRFIHIYHRGDEQSIYIQGQSDTRFDVSDYIEFYGQKNDGALDSLLYKPSSLQPHKYYSLFSDTAAYFLTYSVVPPMGLRMDTEQLVNVNNLPAETYQYTERLKIYHDSYSAGYTISDVTQSTYFDLGEGWTGLPVQQGTSIDYVIDSLFNGVSSAGNPKLELLVVGRDAIPHNITIYVGQDISSLRTLTTMSFTGFNTYPFKSDLLWSDIGSNGKMVVRIEAASASTNRYQASLSYAKVTIPQGFNWTGINQKRFQLEVKPGGQSFLTLSNASNIRMWDITDLQNITSLLPTSTSPFSVIVPGTSVSKKIFTSNFVFASSIIPISFRQIDPSAYNFVIITNKALMRPASGYANPVQAYAAYRASTAGGSYDTLTVTIDQLFNQFNYGETSPLAIYSFMKFMSQGNVKNLFLIGKGRDMDYSIYQRKPLKSGELADFVPSAGYPGGDIAFTAGLNGTTYEPAIPTGRITATTSAQVAAYLNKVKELESQPLQPWAKQLLHLSGGGNATTDAWELAYFKSIVDGFAKIAEGPYLGGNVTTKSKQNVGIETINVSTIVNQGVNLVTFFGHSAPNIIDIDIGNVSDPTLGYNNPGKYPAFLINGCNAGNIFANEITFGEDWILAANKGSRNFIGGTSFGLINDLNLYSTLFYQVGFGDSTFIKKSIGEIQKETGRQYLAIKSANIFSISQVQQMVLSGDPALKLFGTALPDYAIDNGSLSLASLDGKQITSLSDSFAVKIIVKNLGAYSAKPMRVRVIRTFNDGTSKTYDSVYASTVYIDTLQFTIKKEQAINGFGNNYFDVLIDPLNTIKELNETNNTAHLGAYIPSNGTINLYPPPFGIVNSTSFNLVFQDANLLGSQRDFLVQVDTTNTFGSPFTKKQTVNGKVLAKAAINLLQGDSIVYYWRTKPVKLSSLDSSDWTMSSFIYINNGVEGWAQTKFPQTNTDALIHLDADLTKKEFNFLETISHVNIKSTGANSSSNQTDASMNIDGVEYNVAAQVDINCRNNTINLVAFNKETATPYPGLSVYLQDPRGCGLQPSVINSFDPSELEASDGLNILNYVDNIKVSDSVILYSVGNAAFSTWSSNVLTKLNDLGISNSQITSLQDGEPVIIFAKKGSSVGSAKVFRSPSSPASSQDLSVASTVTGKFTSGTIKSGVIGPAKKWMSFSAKASQVESVDIVNYSIYGLSLAGQETLIQSNVQNNLDLSFIDASLYPQLKIQIEVTDSVNQTAAQLKNWFVLYESLADGLLFFSGSTDTQTLQEGQPFSGSYGFTNISSKSFSDSLQVSTDVFTISRSTHSNSSFKIKAPAPGDTTLFTVPVETKDKAGLNNITVFVNPKIQPEQYYENNVIGLDSYLNVLADKSNPILDVTVDGRYLQNGDYVSTSPVIVAKLHDDNPFLYINDTTHLNLFLSYPCDTTPCPFTRINYSRNDVHWTPASASSDFVASFHPSNLVEGTYTLQVSGTDESGNLSGAQPYQVSFQVMDETTFALRSVYPNPSSDVFNFNFVLSGGDLPESFSLQIFSSNGQLLKQFDINDVNGFFIGNNELHWSSLQSGASTGLLIYRLTISANGKSASQSGKLLLLK